jgi:uncharacterized LabA/DUF88 family protein
MLGNYFFVDGSALTAQIRQLWRAQPIFNGRKLCALTFSRHFMAAYHELHGYEYKRITFYFPKGDETAIEDFIIVPDYKQPGNIRDIHFKFCGQKLKKSAEFEQFVEGSVPLKFRDRFAKSEKGIDIEMCCDALKLASASRLERLFLLSNDGDFIPFCRTLKEFGANISIIHLSQAVTPNGELLREADSYDVVPLNALHNMFLPVPIEAEGEVAVAEGPLPSSEKPDDTGGARSDPPIPPPSDLKAAHEEAPKGGTPGQ